MAQTTKKNNVQSAKPVVRKRNRGSSVYKTIYYIGIQTKRFSKRFWSRFKRFVLIPIGHFFVALFSFLYTLVNHFIVKAVLSFIQEGKYFNQEMREAKPYLSRAIKKSSVSAFSVILHYIKKIFNHHKSFLIKSAYVLMPAVSAVILAVTVAYWSNSTFALEVTYEGKNIGYIADETIYLEARKMAEEMLVPKESSDVQKSLLSAPSYDIKRVSVNKLNDSDAIFNNIIQNSANDLTNACGIYINGEFLCSVMNELDAKSVFENMLKAYSVGVESGVTVGFYDDIDYVQGLYPKNESTMWDAAKLSSAVTSVKPVDTETSDVKYIRIKTVKTEYADVKIDHAIEKSESSSLFKGSTKVTQRGSDGIDNVTLLVTYVEGVKVSSQEINRVTVKEPVTEKVLVGTRTTSAASGTYVLAKLESGFVWPTIGAYTITDGFGYYAWRGKVHKAVDISGPNASGKTIVAAAAGTVTHAGWSSGGYGYCVKIDHGNGIETLYAHCLEGSLGVTAGQKVAQGQAIAKIGSTGNATGAHLHFEVIVNGTKVDPQPYLSY